MKSWAAFAILILLIAKAYASCMAGWAEAYPSSGVVPQNSVSLVKWPEGDYHLRSHIRSVDFTAQTSKGQTIRLIPIEVHFSGSLGQVLLKPEKLLPEGDSVFIAVDFSHISSLAVQEQQRYAEQLKWRKWKVDGKVKPTMLQWPTQPVTYTAHESLQAICGGGHSVRLALPLHMDSLLTGRNESKVSQAAFCKIVLGNDTFKEAIDKGAVLVYSGQCGSNFRISPESSYRVRLWLIDNTGNVSLRKEELEFRTADYPKVSIEEKD